MPSPAAVGGVVGNLVPPLGPVTQVVGLQSRSDPSPRPCRECCRRRGNANMAGKQGQDVKLHHLPGPRPSGSSTLICRASRSTSSNELRHRRNQHFPVGAVDDVDVVGGGGEQVLQGPQLAQAADRPPSSPAVGTSRTPRPPAPAGRRSASAPRQPTRVCTASRLSSPSSRSSTQPLVQHRTQRTVAAHLAVGDSAARPAARPADWTNPR